jgi:N-acetylglucosamine-6-phosphate deacetylase
VIDLQVNGAGGYDLTIEPESVWKVGEELTRFGVAAFLPTLVSPPWEIVHRAQEAILAGPPSGYQGATPLGWHVEGPFLSPKHAGAHDPASLRYPTVEAVKDWSPQTGIRVASLAPELRGALDVVRTLVGNGVVVSAGHSAATYQEAQAGFDAGIRMVTHLFNAMAPLDRREPGLIGAALADDRITVCLIPDGVHVHPTLISIVRRAVGPERLAVVSDAIAALGVGPGRHHLAGREIEVDETSARLPNGILAGCIIGIDEAVRNLAAFTGCSLEEARLAATRVPERLLGLPVGSADASSS